MTIAISLDTVPLSEYTIEVTDEPEEVRQALAAIQEQVRAGVRGRPSVTSLNVFIRQANARAARADGRPTDGMRKAMFATANELKLSRDDRLELAEMILNRECDTWGSLDIDEAGKLLTAMNGYILIRHLRRNQ